MHPEPPHRADWLYEAKWGVFCHYLAAADLSADAWNARVESFDVEVLAEQLADVGARYFLFSLGQQSGHWCSPNATYDALTGIAPSKCSHRDLILDIAGALRAHGIKTLVYVPCHAPAFDRAACVGLRCTPPFDAGAWGFKEPLPGHERTDAALSEFQHNWESVIREWSARWGDLVAGWWVDGVYFADQMYHREVAPDFASFADALRAGNPNAVVAFNDGSGCPRPMPVRALTQYEDYTAFEMDYALTFSGHQTPDYRVNTGRFIEAPDGGRVQRHVTTFLGGWWMFGQSRFPDELVIGYTRHQNQNGGVVTWDVPISDNGHIPATFLEQLRLLKNF